MFPVCISGSTEENLSIPYLPLILTAFCSCRQGIISNVLLSFMYYQLSITSNLSQYCPIIAATVQFLPRLLVLEIRYNDVPIFHLLLRMENLHVRINFFFEAFSIKAPCLLSYTQVQQYLLSSRLYFCKDFDYPCSRN